TVPAATMTRLCPGCVCHPLLPPGAQTLFCTYTSDSPFVCCCDNQSCSFAPAFCPLGKELETSIGPNRPTATRLALYPSGGFPNTLPGQMETGAAIEMPSKIRHVRLIRMSTYFPRTHGQPGNQDGDHLLERRPTLKCERVAPSDNQRSASVNFDLFDQSLGSL